MEWSVLAQALGIFLVFEGLWPFVSPQGWREAMRRMIESGDLRIRLMAGAGMAAGLLVLWSAH